MSLARTIVRRRGWIAIFWAAAAVALLPAAGTLERVLDVAARIPGSESATVEEALVERFGSPFARPALLVVTGVPRPDTGAGRAVLVEIVAALEAEAGVARVASYLDRSDPDFLPAEGAGTFVLVGLRSAAGAPDAVVLRLRTVTEGLAAALRRANPAAALRFTGETALNLDLRRTSARQAQDAERRVLPLTLALLLFAFGTATAAILPVGLGCLAIGLTAGLAAILAEHWRLSILLQNVVSMLGLGLGIDYALLVVGRFREGLAAGAGAEDAATEAASEAGHTVLVSGLSVAVGFAGLLLLPLNETRSVAVGGLLVVVVSVAIATTLLPGLLAWLGPRIERGRIGRKRGTGEGWRRWGRWVAARPLRVLVIASIPVVLLSIPAARLSTTLPRGNWLPPEMESAEALRDLQAMGRGGWVQAVRVLVDLPEGAPALGAGGWLATARLTERLVADPRIARVRSLPGFAGGGLEGAARAAFLPADLQRLFVSEDGRTALVEAVPREGVDPEALATLVGELRRPEAAAALGVSGVQLRVGGLPAFNVDYREAVSGALPRVVGVVLLGTFVALALAFRSLLIPIKALILNLLSVTVAFGATVLVFQEGHGARWLGLEGATGGVFPVIPALVFCVVFGLSMDYEVFLVARVAEARRAGRDEGEAVAEGLFRSGRLITMAASVMVAVFGAFTLGAFLLMKMLGFALAVAVVVDATVIRVALGPALLRLAGKWNWWPGETGGRRTPRHAPAASRVPVRCG